MKRYLPPFVAALGMLALAFIEGHFGFSFLGQVVTLVVFMFALPYFYRLAEGRRYRRGMYIGSFDPVTDGHMDTAIKAAARCRELIMVVAVNPAKKRLFTGAECVAYIQRLIALRGVTNIRVIEYAGLGADAYVEYDCDAYFRGVRDSKDEYEENILAESNRLVWDGINTVFLRQNDRMMKLISSSMLKLSALMDLSVPNFAPAFIREQVEARVRGIIRIGIVGGIACGKTHVAKALELRLKAKYGDALVHRIDMDQLLRDAYDGPSDGSVRLRRTLKRRFGAEVLSADGNTVNREFLKGRLFGHTRQAKRDMRWVEDLTKAHVMRLYRNAQRGKFGIVLVEMAQLFEKSLEHMVCNRVILVGSPDCNRFAAIRGIPADRLEKIRGAQWTTERRENVLRASIALEGGNAFVYNNIFGGLPSDLSTVTAETSMPSIDALVEQLDQQVIAARWGYVTALASPPKKAA